VADLEGYKNGEVTYIPDRLISDPIVFRGMTDQEVIWAAGIGAAVWVPISCLVLSIFGKAMFGLALGAGLTLLTVIYVGKRLTDMKRNMPDGLHIVAIKKWLQEKGIHSSGYINKSQDWDIRRSKQVERVMVEKEDI